MARKKKEAKITSFNLNVDIINSLEQYCAETGLSKTVAVERFILQGIEEYNKRKRDSNS